MKDERGRIRIGSFERVGSRRRRLARFCRARGLDGFLVSDPINVGYLSGFSGQDSYLFLAGRTEVLVTDGRFAEQLADECPGLDAYVRRPGQSMDEAAARVIRQARCRQVGFESSAMSVAQYERLRERLPAVEWLGLDGTVEGFRLVKDSHEVRQIRQAIAIAERALAMFRAGFRASESEKSLADTIELHVRRAGGRSTAFPPIVAAGARSSLPHAVPTNRPCDQSDFLLVDWGACGPLYHSDLTRILVTRKITPKLARVHGIVRRAQQCAFRMIRPGVVAEQVDTAARRVIEEAGFGRRFRHSLGHGLGLQIHEGPALRKGSRTVLQPGMVVTVEPGIYLPGWGGVRLEDDVLVTRDGCEILTSVPTDLEEMITPSLA